MKTPTVFRLQTQFVGPAIVALGVVEIENRRIAAAEADSIDWVRQTVKRLPRSCVERGGVHVLHVFRVLVDVSLILRPPSTGKDQISDPGVAVDVEVHGLGEIVLHFRTEAVHVAFAKRTNGSIDELTEEIDRTAGDRLLVPRAVRDLTLIAGGERRLPTFCQLLTDRETAAVDSLRVVVAARPL